MSKSKRNIIIILLVLFVCAIVLIFIAYSNISHNIARGEVNMGSINTNTESEEIEEETVTFTTSELEELLTYLPVVYDYNVYDYNSYYTSVNNYISGTLLQSNIDTYYLVAQALGSLCSSYDTCSSTLSVSDVKDRVYEMYNKNVTNFDSEYIYDNVCFYLEGSSFTYDECNTNNPSIASYIYDYDVNGDELVIYEYAGEYSEDFDGTKSILNYKDKTSIDISSCEDIDCADNYVKTNYSLFTLYKHTFQKINENYYWYKTEI